MKIVINCCFGGFSLSKKALLRLRELKEETALNDCLKGETYEDGSVCDFDCNSYCREIPRNSKLLLQVIKELGKDANGDVAELKVVKIPDGTEWQIEEYDGSEHIAEKHETWS